MAAVNVARFAGRSLDALALKERWALTGMWIATELYSPERLPLRLMAAIGTDARDCIAQLRQKGLDLTLYEYEPVGEPYTASE